MSFDGIVVAIYEVVVTAADYHLAITELTLGYSAFLALIYHTVLVILAIVFPMVHRNSYDDKIKFKIPFWREVVQSFLLAAHSVIACRASGLLPLISSELSLMWASWNDAYALEGYSLSIPCFIGILVPLSIGIYLNSLGVFYFVTALLIKHVLRASGHNSLRPFSAESNRTQFISLTCSVIIFLIVQHDLNVDHILLHMSHKSQLLWFALIIILGILHHFDAFYRRSQRRSSAERALALDNFLKEAHTLQSLFSTMKLFSGGKSAPQFYENSFLKENEEGSSHLTFPENDVSSSTIGRSHLMNDQNCPDDHALASKIDKDPTDLDASMNPSLNYSSCGPSEHPSPFSDHAQPSHSTSKISGWREIFQALPPIQGAKFALSASNLNNQQQQPIVDNNNNDNNQNSDSIISKNVNNSLPFFTGASSSFDIPSSIPIQRTNSCFGSLGSPSSGNSNSMACNNYNNNNNVVSKSVFDGVDLTCSNQDLFDNRPCSDEHQFAPVGVEDRITSSPVSPVSLLSHPSLDSPNKTELDWIPPHQNLMRGVNVPPPEQFSFVVRERVVVAAFRSLCLGLIGVEVYSERWMEALTLSLLLAALSLMFLLLREPPFFGTVQMRGWRRWGGLDGEWWPANLRTGEQEGMEQMELVRGRRDWGEVRNGVLLI